MYMNDKPIAGYICLDGMCPYVPCLKFPNCIHVQSLGDIDKDQERIDKRAALHEHE